MNVKNYRFSCEGNKCKKESAFFPPGICSNLTEGKKIMKNLFFALRGSFIKLQTPGAKKTRVQQIWICKLKKKKKVRIPMYLFMLCLIVWAARSSLRVLFRVAPPRLRYSAADCFDQASMSVWNNNLSVSARAPSAREPGASRALSAFGLQMYCSKKSKLVRAAWVYLKINPSRARRFFLSKWI